MRIDASFSVRRIFSLVSGTTSIFAPERNEKGPIAKTASSLRSN